ncbi:hypothetical protein [Salinirussus salinus]|uniref:hypothetical protein n=1 Tax=Salinirussus salinus TaxID=1198300 RepID=UPI00135928C5|nr:hypothetical protein [Salinirussus salinus]
MRVRDLVFGDRVGLAVFLGVVCFAGLYWRADVFITDNLTLIETLSAMSEGQLWVEPATGNYFDAPGTVVQDGLVYGRNYGQLALSLPVLWLLQGVTAVANLHLALTALWHLALLGLILVLGRVYGRERLARLGGAAVVGVSFLVNLTLLRQFLDPSLPLIALQISTLLAAGLGTVLLYRLLAWQHNRRLGVLAGAAVVVVSPVGFWATIPKRHVLVATLCVAVLYLFARSREPSGRSWPLVGAVPERRALMYACIALITWVHAAEGLFVFLAVAAFDLPTAPANDRRTLAFLGVVFGLAMVPFFVTNLLVAGSPVEPPRGLYSQGLAADLGGDGAAGGGSGGGGGGRGSGTGRSGGGGTGFIDGLVGTVTGFVSDFFLVTAAAYVFSFVLGIVTDGLSAVGDTQTLYHAFVRSSGEAIGGNPQFRGINLAVLESMPLLGALGGAVAAGGSCVANGSLERLRGVTATDGLAVGMCLALAVIYLDRLPLQVQINARYVLPVYPLALYLVARMGPVRRIVDIALGPILWTYAAGVLVGTQLFVVYVAVRGLSVAEAAQTHALVGILAAVLLFVALLAYLADERLQTPAAAALGFAAATGTAFLLLTGLDYFGFLGNYVLPVAGAVVDALA